MMAPPVVHHESILEYWANRPNECLFFLAGLALFAAFVGLGESLMPKMAMQYRVKARRISIGALHTAIWSLAAAIYLTLGPDVGVIPVDGPDWTLVGGMGVLYLIFHWARSDPTVKVG